MTVRGLIQELERHLGDLEEDIPIFCSSEPYVCQDDEGEPLPRGLYIQPYSPDKEYLDHNEPFITFAPGHK